jgi:endonuclease/exonuclease/phosphatase family metal-dependent hydrolase
MMTPKRKKGGLSRLFAPVLLLVTWAVAIVTFSALFAGFISPVRLWQPAFAGLAYPFLALINLFLIVVWLLIRPRYILIPALTLLAGYGVLTRHYNLKHPHEFAKNDQHIRIATYNAHYYNIWAKYGKPDYDTLALTEQFFKLESPHILCIQEGITSHARTGNITERIRKNLNYNHVVSYPYFPGGSSGMQIFFNGRLMDQGIIDHEGRTIAVYADIEIRGVSVRVYNLHLQSIRLGDQEYVVHALKTEGYRDSLFLSGSKVIAGRLRNAFRVRAAQAELVRAHVEGSPMPVIVCGDFNDTPASYAYHKIRRAGITDAFKAAGNGMGRTYRGKFPSYRIDYIMASPELEVKGFQTLKPALSDHNPVFVWYQLPNTNQTP